MTRIVSSIPGRIRIRDKALRHANLHRQLERKVQQLPGVTACRVTPATGSVLVYFTKSVSEQKTMEVEISQTIDAVLTLPKPTKKAKSVKKHLNRYSKLVMLSSLAASLAFTANRRHRRLHILTGKFFVAGLLVHLGIYRKLLLR